MTLRCERTWWARVASATLAWVLLSAPVGSAPDAGASTPESYVVIVNPANPADSATRASVSRMFLKRLTRFREDRTRVMPVDLPMASAIRRGFTRGVHERSLSNVATYWRRTIYSGRESPPPVKATDQEVIAFVREHRGAIGYVSSGVELAGVKVLQVTDDDES